MILNMSRLLGNKYQAAYFYDFLSSQLSHAVKERRSRDTVRIMPSYGPSVEEDALTGLRF